MTEPMMREPMMTKPTWKPKKPEYSWQPKNPHIKLIKITVDQLPRTCSECDFLMDENRSNPDLGESLICRITDMAIYQENLKRDSACPLEIQTEPQNGEY